MTGRVFFGKFIGDRILATNEGLVSLSKPYPFWSDLSDKDRYIWIVKGEVKKFFTP